MIFRKRKENIQTSMNLPLFVLLILMSPFLMATTSSFAKTPSFSKKAPLRTISRNLRELCKLSEFKKLSTLPSGAFGCEVALRALAKVSNWKEIFVCMV